MKLRALKVKEINNYIKNIMARDPILNNIKVEGEISNLKKHSSGHWYFSLKDESAVLNCVMFKDNTLGVAKNIEDGSKVSCSGYISIYERDGKYQLYVKEMEEIGLGELHLKFEALKEKLLKKGYFDIEIKKEIPKHPNTIGVVTSHTGAALRDILNVGLRRSKKTNVIIYPAAVQGVDAKDTISTAIKKANEQKKCDILIVGRGGGSIEDLWAFNEEIVADAIFKSKIPVISAVGHEIDFTISDFVSDLRAPTPSASAELAFPDDEGTMEYLNGLKNKLENNIKRSLSDYKMEIELSNPTREASVILANIDSKRYELDQYISIIMNAEKSKISNIKNDLDILVHRLNNLSPLATLSRGYGIVLDESDKRIKSTEDVNIDDLINIKISDGDIKAKVTGIIKGDERNG
jgi:exodeoxyribonuclease VII large subunit